MARDPRARGGSYGGGGGRALCRSSTIWGWEPGRVRGKARRWESTRIEKAWTETERCGPLLGQQTVRARRTLNVRSRLGLAFVFPFKIKWDIYGGLWPWNCPASHLPICRYRTAVLKTKSCVGFAFSSSSPKMHWHCKSQVEYGPRYV